MRGLSVLCLVACACGPSTPPPVPAPGAPEAPVVAEVTDDPDAAAWSPEDSAAGVSHAALRDLLSAQWAWTMEHRPQWATRLGIHRFDDRLDDRSARGIELGRKKDREWLERARALEAGARLDAVDAATLELFIERLEHAIASEVCNYHEWSVDPRRNPVTEWNRLPKLHRVKTVADGKNLEARYRLIRRSIADEASNLRRGAARGLYANAHSVRLVIEMLDKQLAEPVEEWPLMEPARAERPGWSESEVAAHRSALVAAIGSPGKHPSIAASLEAYSETLKEVVLPKARGPEAEGLGALPGGAACYEARVRAYTTLDRTPKQIHELGLREIERINGEMRDLGKKALGTRTLAATLARLRSDQALYFREPAEIVRKAEGALAAARAKIPEFFGRLPKADCVVKPIPDYEAPYTTIAYYRPPHPDGSKPGEYFINVHRPETRPRFEAEVLAFHESIPGHHLQIAISQELQALPAFRKHAGMTAFVEGWGLYTERLSGEMGLYSGDLDRMGMLSFDAWRAARLVVDTGIHAMGWTRERAVKFMLEHTALAENNIRNEVDRYIVWPGQALAYKLGQLFILELRARAEKELGNRFDIKAFHDTVLGAGAVTLPMLDARVTAWIKAQ